MAGVGLLTLTLGVTAAPLTDDDGARLAWGNGVVLTAEELKAELNSAPPDALARIVQDPQRAYTVVTGLINLQVLGREAERLGLLADPALQHRIARANAQMVAEALRDHALASIPERDFTALAEETYRANPDAYRVPEQVHARHILRKTAPGADAAPIRVQLEAIAARIDGGEDFAALAKEFSEDKGSAEKGGDLGFFGRGRMAVPFEEAAFALKEPGQLSPVTETRFGLHLIQLVERKPASVRPFAEVKAVIVSKLNADYRRDYLAAWEQDLIKAANIEMDTDRVRAVFGGQVPQPPSGK
jgi:peptidyl-prolyl cis-trans isomerase C